MVRFNIAVIAFAFTITPALAIDMPPHGPPPPMMHGIPPAPTSVPAVSGDTKITLTIAKLNALIEAKVAEAAAARADQAAAGAFADIQAQLQPAPTTTPMPTPTNDTENGEHKTK